MTGLAPLLIVQGLHLFGGIAWGGGQLLLAFGVWPALLRLPAADARRAVDKLEGPVGLFQMLAGSGAIVLGVIRAVRFGPVDSWESAVGTHYGRTCLVALALAVVLAVRGARTSHLHARLFEGEAFHPRARSRLRLEHTVDILILMGIMACMVMLHVGL